jgi:ABC-type branched-subunit amino acid transport system substrate-binding protein
MRYQNALRLYVAACLFAVVQAPAFAQDTVKIAYVDPLSGGGASIGEVGVKTFSFLADEINAKGGVLGKKLEIVAYDNKLNPQESLVQIQKAIDSGIRIVTQGNGSAVAAAISDFAAKFNERNPDKEFLFLNYAAVDPVLTNEKCNFWHFRWDANSDIKMEALSNYMKTRPGIKKLYLINQDYSFGQAVRAEAKKMIAQKRPDIQIVGDELHPPACKSTGTPITPAAPADPPPSSRAGSIIACSRSPRGAPISRTSPRRTSSGRSAPSTTSGCSIRASSTRCACWRRRSTKRGRSSQRRSQPSSKA